MDTHRASGFGKTVRNKRGRAGQDQGGRAEKQRRVTGQWTKMGERRGRRTEGHIPLNSFEKSNMKATRGRTWSRRTRVQRTAGLGE